MNSIPYEFLIQETIYNVETWLCILRVTVVMFVIINTEILKALATYPSLPVNFFARKLTVGG